MSCCPATMGDCSRENLFRARVLQVLSCLQGDYPTLFTKADFWRRTPVANDPDQYADETPQVWVRLGEEIPVFFFEMRERFYQADIGIINQRSKYLLIPNGMGLVAGDHAIVHGESYFIFEHETQAGIERLKIQQEKSQFIMPGRSVPTYREFSMRVRLA